MEFTTKFAIGLENSVETRLLREEIFVEEQGFEEEFDAIDPIALHMVLYADGVPAATGRLYEDDTGAHIGRVAVRKAYRGTGLGAMVMDLLEERAKQQQIKRISLSAQIQAQGFYEKQGYTPVGEIYYEEFCPHVRMEKQLIAE
jgi:predicted GNAT family N-acyltransferase